MQHRMAVLRGCTYSLAHFMKLDTVLNIVRIP